MQKLVQSAIEAAKQGNKSQAIEYLKQAITANPNDLEALIILGKIVTQPEQKRQIFNRVLKLDPTNKIAREEMVNLDRLAMGDFQKYAEPPASEKTQSPPASVYTHAVDKINGQHKVDEPAPVQSDGININKPIVFRYPFRGRVGYFIIAAIFGCIGLLIIVQGSATSLPLLCMGILFGLAALSNQSNITVTNSNVRLSNLFSKAELRWDEIASIKSNVMGKKLELIPSRGNALKISNQIEGYPALVEIIRQKRPDLFKIISSQSVEKNAPVNKFDVSPSMNVDSVSRPRYTGVKTFSKNFIGQYGILLFMLPLCIIGPLFIYLKSDWFVGVSIGLIGLFFMASSLFNINQVTLDSNKLTAESFLQQKDYTANQIKEISMKTVRSRRGIATNFVNIQPMEGNAISMAGFPEGDELIYATLIEWWNTHKYN